jgi:hypothetical protein
MIGGSVPKDCKDLGHLLGDPSRGFVGGCRDRRRQWRPGLEPRAFGEVKDKTSRQPTKAARQFDRLGNAEPMRRTIGKAGRQRRFAPICGGPANLPAWFPDGGLP